MIMPRIRYRRNPDFNVEARDRHALQIGRVSMASNTLHENFFLLFWWLTGNQMKALAHGIWHSASSDAAQRKFLRAAALTQTDKRLIGALDWMLKQAEKIGSDRNALIHSPMTNTISADGKLILTPSQLGGKASHLERLRTKPSPKDWDTVRGNLWVLAQYAQAIDLYLMHNSSATPQPWPHRPRLLRLEGAVKPRPRKARNTKHARRTPPQA